MKRIHPKLDLNAFSCPHCQAMAQQRWYGAQLSGYDNDNGPVIPTDKSIEILKTDSGIAEDSAAVQFLRKLASKELFLDGGAMTGSNPSGSLVNLYVSECSACLKFSVWIGDDLFYPPLAAAIKPVEGMPPEIQKDFNEAAQIVDSSPRAAAALLRLAIQKAIQALGFPGKSLDGDLAVLVQKGLDPRIRKSLDMVRVIGIRAIQPGQIDASDDSAVAMQLFTLVNLLVETMVVVPKRVADFYENLLPANGGELGDANIDK